MSLHLEEDEDDQSGSVSMKTLGTEKLIDTTKRDPLTGSLAKSEKDKLMQLVDRWEEPDRQSAKLVSPIYHRRNFLLIASGYLNVAFAEKPNLYFFRAKIS